MRAAPDAPVVSVLALEDDAPFLGAVRAVIGATSGFEMVAEAQSREEALDLAARCASVFMAKTRFGRQALASAWARFGRPARADA